MRNIVDEKPTDPLHGHTLYATQFVSSFDIKDKKVLDIGCGFGWLEFNFLERGVGHITGIEVSEEDLQTAKKYIKNDKIDFRVASAIELPFADQSFDTVISYEVIEHIPKNTENKMFKEVHRVLRENGVFYLSTPYDSFFGKVLDPAWWLIGHRHYSQGRLTSWGRENSFKTERVFLNGGWWEIISIWDLYLAKWLFRRRPFFENFFNKKQDFEYRRENGFMDIFIEFRKNHN